MKDTRLIMGMPITVEIVDAEAAQETLEAVFAYFTEVDERFSTYKDTSEISHINKALTTKEGAPQGDGPRTEQFRSNEIVYPGLVVSAEMREVLSLSEKTKQETAGYFDIEIPGTLASPVDGLRPRDPSGIVKGWAINNAAKMLAGRGIQNFFVEAGGDIQAYGKNAEGSDWSVGIRNPFNQKEIVKVIYPRGLGVATSGSYERGNHIYNPHSPTDPLQEIVSITVVGPNVLEADRMATAAFAMGAGGVTFIENLDGFEAYSIDRNGIATMTRGFLTLTQ